MLDVIAYIWTSDLMGLFKIYNTLEMIYFANI